MFLPAHSSHLTQPLDLGTFGLVKRLLRREANYTLASNIPVDKQQLDLNGDGENSSEAADINADAGEGQTIDLNDEDVPQPNRAERGLALAEYVLDILDAFERSTSRRLVVSAFRQAGILSRFPDLNNLTRRVTYVDPSFARAVIKNTGRFQGEEPIFDDPRRLLKIQNLRHADPSRVELDRTHDTDTDGAPAEQAQRVISASEAHEHSTQSTQSTPVVSAPCQHDNPAPPTQTNADNHAPIQRSPSCPHCPVQNGPLRPRGTQRSVYNTDKRVYLGAWGALPSTTTHADKHSPLHGFTPVPFGSSMSCPNGPLPLGNQWFSPDNAGKHCPLRARGAIPCRTNNTNGRS